MQSSTIYLDHNATTPLLPEVITVMTHWIEENHGNAGCEHSYGKAASDAIDTAREQVATLLGCTANEITFTSGGTESNNLATIGVLQALTGKPSLITSTIEHPAISEPRLWLHSLGYPTALLPADTTGRVNPDDLEPLLTSEHGLISVMHSNNEVGTIQPISELSVIAKRKGHLVHTDASQSIGKVELSVDDLGVDLLTIAGHKLYAPKGIGALYVRAGTPIGPVIRGAGQEGGLRPGTQPVALIVGLGEACRLARQDQGRREQHLLGLRDQLHHQLLAAIPALRLHGHPVHRLPNTLNVGFPKVSGRQLLTECPGIAASTGSACHELGEEPSPILTAMGINRVDALGAVRLTVGATTTADDVQRAATLLIAAWRRTTVY